MRGSKESNFLDALDEVGGVLAVPSFDVGGMQ